MESKAGRGSWIQEEGVWESEVRGWETEGEASGWTLPRFCSSVPRCLREEEVLGLSPGDA